MILSGLYIQQRPTEGNIHSNLYTNHKNHHESKPAAEYVYDAREGLVFPLDCDCSISVVVPVARSRDVQPAVRLLHDDTVRDILEVLVHSNKGFQNLSIRRRTSSQMTLDHT